MNSHEAADKPTPALGYLSVTSGLFGLILFFGFLVLTKRVAYPGWFNEYPQYWVQYVLMALLGIGLLSGIVGLIRREQSGWLSVGGSILCLYILGVLTVFFRWLEE